jgi:hypothetical protein
MIRRAVESVLDCLIWLAMMFLVFAVVLILEEYK